MKPIGLCIVAMALAACSSNQPTPLTHESKGNELAKENTLSTQSIVKAVPAAVVRAPVTVSHNQLNYAGYPTRPRIEGNNSLDIVQSYKLTDRDLYVLQDTGGTACPATFYIAEVNSAGFRITNSFGTCSDLIKISQRGDGISLTMPGFAGPFEPDSEQEEAGNQTHKFTYVNGSIEESTTTKRIGIPAQSEVDARQSDN